jgi:hypothetical protein
MKPLLHRGKRFLNWPFFCLALTPLAVFALLKAASWKKEKSVLYLDSGSSSTAVTGEKKALRVLAAELRKGPWQGTVYVSYSSFVLIGQRKATVLGLVGYRVQENLLWHQTQSPMTKKMPRVLIETTEYQPISAQEIAATVTSKGLCSSLVKLGVQVKVTRNIE